MIKKIFLIVSMSCLSMIGYSQEEKPETGKGSPEMVAIETAASLAKYGYANYSPGALIEAAQIFNDIQTQELGVGKENVDITGVKEKESEVSFEPKQLLADAKKFAGDDQVILAYISQVENEFGKGNSRGSSPSGKHASDRVMAKSTDVYKVTFIGKQLAEVLLSGDGDTDLDLYIYDQGGHLIASDDDYMDQCVCRWYPAWTGEFTIKIVNRGSVYNRYQLWTN